MSIERDKMEDNPNSKARVGFVVFYPIHFYFLKNIYEQLNDEAEFIIDEGQFFPMPQPPDVLENTISLLKQKGVYFRVLRKDNYYDRKYIQAFFSNYQALVALWWTGSLRLPYIKGIKKVHINYGAGKELSIFKTVSRYWDLYLCFSSYIYEIIHLMTNAEIVGNPKFDDWFNNKIDKHSLADLQNRLDPSKKTILYLPTHGDLSSIDELSAELKKISSIYNILVKFHYYTPREEPERVKQMEHAGFHLFYDHDDLLPLLKVSDVVLNDNSSAIFDGILADRPVVLTDFLSSDYLDKGHKMKRRYKFRLADRGLTYSQSIEQKIKKNNEVVVVRFPAELLNALKTALNDEVYFKEMRKKIRNNLFSFNDGKCGERAAKAIKKLCEENVARDKPVLYHVLESETDGRELAGLYYKNEELIQNNNTTDNVLIWHEKRGRYIRIDDIRLLPFFKKISLILREFFA